MRAKSMILILIALGCGLVASIGISQVMQDRGGDEGVAVETAPVLVARADIDIGENFTAQNVALEQWPVDKVPNGTITANDDLIDRFPRQRLFAGEPILEAKLMGENSADSTKIPEGYRVAAVKVNVDGGGAGLIQPGDRVDVIAFLKKGPEVDQTMSRTILTDVRVFAVDSKTERTIDEEGKSTIAKTISLLVKRNQVEALMLAVELGKLRLSLRRPNEKDEEGGPRAATLDTLTGAPTEKADDGSEGAADAAPETGNPGLLDFLGDQPPAPATTEPAATPPPVEPAPQPVEPKFVMEISTPDGVQRYLWHDESKRPELDPTSFGPPAVAPVVPHAGATVPVEPPAADAEEPAEPEETKETQPVD